jgi:intraflagellar transport protein 80
VFGFLIERSVSWQNVEVKLTENNKLVITDYQNQDMQDIDFKDKLVDMSLGYNYLISITSTQCHIFNIYNLQTPYKFDLKETIKMILLCPRYFVLIDDNNKINVN